MRLSFAFVMRTIVACVVAAGAGCSSVSMSIQTALDESGKPDSAGVVAVPFLLVHKYKEGKGDQIWEDAALTDRFATGMLAKGYKILDRSFIRKTLAEQNLTPSDIFKEDRIPQLGQLLGADIIVLGKYTIVELKDGRALDKRLHIRGIRAADGLVVFSLSAMDTTKFRQLRVEQLVDESLRQLGAVPDGEGQGQGEGEKK